MFELLAFPIYKGNAWKYSNDMFFKTSNFKTELLSCGPRELELQMQFTIMRENV